VQCRAEHAEIHHGTRGTHHREADERARRAHPDPPRIDDELDDVIQTELAMTVFAIDEVDWNFLDDRA